MAVEIARLTAEQAVSAAPALRAIYRGAFAAAPYFEGDAEAESFATDTLPRHAHYPDFRCVVASAPDSAVGSTALVGFAYGYSSTPGQWWHDLMASAMDDEMRRRWLAHAFEFVELAVLPAAQGQGIGGRLHDAVLADLPHATAVLSTALVETPALHLYLTRGWVPLVDRFVFPSGAPAVVLGLDLRHRWASDQPPQA